MKLLFKIVIIINLINKILNWHLKPNIIAIVADDVGWNDFGFHGSNQIPTPNIDALAYNGVILDKFYTQQTCTPSRASFLTGNYPIHLGLQGTPIRAGEDRSLPLNIEIMPELLKKLGYNTHLIGKWHLGFAKKKYTPLGRGFDSHFGYWNGFVGYFDYFGMEENPRMEGLDLHYNFKPQWPYIGTYATNLFTKKAIEIIDENEGEPLFLMLAHLAGHTGANGTELGVPDINQTNNKYKYIKDEPRRRYADIVNILDDSVGQVVQKLQEKQMLDNSIILFFSDNGAQTVGMYQNYGSNWPFRGLKFTLFEGGVKGTGIIYSPLFKKTGYINRELIHISDFLPTFFYIAGGNLEYLEGIDGINQWQTISENLTTHREEILLNIDEVRNYSAILMGKGRFKLINGTHENGVNDNYYGETGRGVPNPSYNLKAILESPTNQAIRTISSQPLTVGKITEIRSELDRGHCRSSSPAVKCQSFCLFDLVKDPCETTNIIGDNLKIANDLKMRLMHFYRELQPQSNKEVDLRANPVNFNNTWSPWLDLEMDNKGHFEPPWWWSFLPDEPCARI